MEKMMYLAAQYLAAAAINFVEKKDDDSHTNLGFSVADGKMYTRTLNKAGATLALDYNTFSLEWRGNGNTTVLRLDGITHAEIVKWIQQMVADSGFDRPFVYGFHYDLPYEITDDFAFKLLDATKLETLRHNRILAQLALETFLEEQRLESEIRTWPHHYDTGAFTNLADGSGRSIGLGLAVPDSLIPEHYFYLSGYDGHEGIDTSGFKKLSLGQWKNDSFKGALLPASGLEVQEVALFFQEATNAYVNH